MKNDPPKGKSSKNMKNCRRWRRRSSNINGEFKAKKGWLETHLWHVKRCKMIDYWGYKVSAHLNEKCFKSTYRSAIKGALLHDFSYWHSYWMDMESSDFNQLVIDFEVIDENMNVINIILEHENVQVCPMKIINTLFTRPVLFLHPAAVQTGILEDSVFIEFIKKYSIKLSSAINDLCIFKLSGLQSEKVLNRFLFNSESNNLSFPCRLSVSDPRIIKSNSYNHMSKEEFEVIFLRKGQELVPTDDSINLAKSEFYISEQCELPIASNSLLTLGITKENNSSINNDFYIICPRNWARIFWYKLVQIKPIKIAGIEQIDRISFEFGRPVYPRDYVSSPGYDKWSEMEKCRLENIYNKKPPAKRLSYKKLGIESPFKAPFEKFKTLQLIKVILEIEGKGIITDFAEVYTTCVIQNSEINSELIEKQEMILIGFVTSAVSSSLKKGRSAAVASVLVSKVEQNQIVLIKNHSIPGSFRTAKLLFISK